MAHTISAYSHRIQETSLLEGNEYDQLYYALESLMNRSIEASDLEELEAVINETRTFIIVR